ncbi:MAG: hypothetical protein AB1437_21670 [Pseudomonadota bacterium]
MSWEYRVMDRNGELAIYEVYYHDDGRVQGYTSDPGYPAGDTVDELRENLKQYCGALNKLVLPYIE